jgi:hypothetical protein
MSLGQYYNDIFYNINNLPLKTQIEILRDVKEVCFHWWIDILDCTTSFKRERIDMSFDEAIAKCDQKTHFVFIHRRGYDAWKEENEIMMGWRLEVGYRTMALTDYFLWIEAKEDKIEDFVLKYKLSVLR